MEDGDGNIKDDCVNDKSAAVPVNDVQSPSNVCTILRLKKKGKKGSINVAKECESPSNVETPTKVNGELESDNTVVEHDNQPAKVIISRKRKSKINADTVVVNEKKVDDNSENSVAETRTVEYKGFKKRILAQAEKLNDVNDTNSSEETEVNNKTTPATVSGKKNKVPEKDSAQQEYAQYLGLQPTVKFKCYKCGEKVPTMALLHGHQRVCGSVPLKVNQPPISPVDPNLSTNFRITRKVYLCSACGTYYENWNLFLHMREVHKRHICLFCLGMFSVADKLAEHLVSKHSIHETNVESHEEFISMFKGSCFLMCCSCEKIFTEREEFYGHLCADPGITALNVKCPLCNVKCGHFMTCPNNTPHTSAGTTTKPSSGMAVTKYLMPVNKNVSDKWAKNKTGAQRTKSVSGEYEDDYDISNAASFCHVDLADEGSVDKSVTNSDKETENRESVEKEDKSEETKEDETPIVVPLEPLKVIANDIENEPDKQKESNEKCTDSATEDAIVNNVSPDCSVSDSGEKVEEKIEDKELGKTSDTVTSENITASNEKVTDETESTSALPTSESPVNDKIDENKIAADDTRADDQIEKQEESQTVSNSDAVGILKNDEKTVKADDKTTDSLSESGNSDADMEQEMPNHDNDMDDSAESSDEHVEQNDNKPSENGDNSDSDSEDSEKLSLVVDDKVKNDTENELTRKNQNNIDNKLVNDDSVNSTSFDVQMDSKDKSNSLENNPPLKESSNCDGIQLASEDVAAMALTLEDKLNAINAKAVIKECVRTSCTTCVYCSHAVKIAVNGKQLALHLLAEHRYTPVKNESVDDVVNKLKSSLPDLENVFFNTDSYDSSDKTLNVPHDQTYECFQCHFVTNSHKDLYVHKKKMHQKTILLCVMCKSNFYSYSELLCHMCPGIYISEDILFRCCYCNTDRITSAFRLMVHLRKSHHTCDICLEVPGDQQKLSTHMWKHKLHHLCYKCGIAYRNKPDITKHLFWKHGTESVLCKKCLQKKWPHVYHFCIPPTVFICEECNASFSRAVALKVHKRLHGGDLPYACDQCDQKFISKKLLIKHEETHKVKENINDTSEQKDKENEIVNVESLDGSVIQNENKLTNSTMAEGEKTDAETPDCKSHKKRKKDKDKKNKQVMDVYDLPPLNLSSESDDSDEDNKTSLKKSQSQEEEINKIADQVQDDKLDSDKQTQSITDSEEPQLPAPVVDGVWDNFHSYKAELEKREALDSLNNTNTLMNKSTDDQITALESDHSNNNVSKEINDSMSSILADHDYCLVSKDKEMETETPVDEKPAPREHSSSIDHDYCSNNNTEANEVVATTENLPTDSQQPSTTTETSPSPKKKAKVSKKKFNKHNSSSSSDSSSDSDSTSCSCGTNCSCSSSSSNTSSSSSSDSDSSSSEGRQRAAARRERRKDKVKPSQEDNITIEQPPEPPTVPTVEDEPVIDLPPEPIETKINESDLDTDETLTDEDFYDQHPQRHANQLLAEKRNQLLSLAAATQINNGTVSPTQAVKPPTPPPVSPPVQKEPTPPPAAPTSTKRKIKSKKRKKSQQQIKATVKEAATLLYDTPSTSFPAKKSLISPTNTNNTMLASPHHQGTNLSDTAGGSGSETDNARLSKRKRVRNKFYGYSSDEEEENKPILGKWRKVEPTVQPATPTYNYQRPVQKPTPPVEVRRVQKQSDSSASDDDEVVPAKKAAITSNSSGSSSESDTEVKPAAAAATEQTEKNDNLYCYCQCPYDEVSEMIACDGLDCTIEWFHFECVGIMVPPKGKWYCPDCRKRRDSM